MLVLQSDFWEGIGGCESELVSQIGTVGHQAAVVVEGIDFQRKFRQALL